MDTPNEAGDLALLVIHCGKKTGTQHETTVGAMKIIKVGAGS